MDAIIKNYLYESKNGLNYCEDEGVAYQSDMNKSVSYDFAYFEKYVMYETTPLGVELNKRRLEAVRRWAVNLKIIDIGIGCGTFIKYALASGLNISGYDINPCSIHWLVKHGVYDDIYKTDKKIMCYTFWDSLEHIPEPQKILDKIELGAFVFVSMPTFNDLDDIIKSKHYRPDEHYYYFTPLGLIKWFSKYNMRVRSIMDFEQKVGREGIKTFLFERMPAKRNKNKKHDLLSDYFKYRNDATIEITKILGLRQ